MNRYEQLELAELVLRAVSMARAEGEANGRVYETLERRQAASAAAEHAMREVWEALYRLRVEGSG